MTIGIYRLCFEGLEDWYYIGQSSNIEERYIGHKSNLRLGKGNYLLLEAYSIAGKYPSIEILEECTISELSTKELFYIKKFDSYKNGLNLTNKVDKLGRGEENFNSIITNEEVITLLFYLVNNPTEMLTSISKELGIPMTVVSMVNRGQNHTWLKELYPNEYNKMLSINRQGIWNAKNQGIVYPKVMSPDGAVFEVTNLQQFAREHKINNSSLCNLLHGKRKTANKWKLAI